MKIHFELEQRTDEWFKMHLGKFSASNDFSTLANGVKFKDPTKTELKKNPEAKPVLKYSDAFLGLCWEKAAERITGRFADKKQKGFTNFHMDRGIEMEDEARLALELETGLEFQEVGLVEIDDYTVFSPDGIIYSEMIKKIVCGLELKCKDNKGHLICLSEGSKTHKWQVGGSLVLSNAEKWIFSSYNPHFPLNKRLFIQDILPDEDIRKRLLLGLEHGKKRIKEIVDKHK